MAFSAALHDIQLGRSILPGLNRAYSFAQASTRSCAIRKPAFNSYSTAYTPGKLFCASRSTRANSSDSSPTHNLRASATSPLGITTAKMPMVQDTIVLNEAEKELLDVLLAAAQYAETGTVLRCAGGWVRDKLLGKDSLDIDIALDNMLGKDFAEKVNEYLKSQGKETRNAAVIQSNPDQSKHLETARMKVNNIWIDLVNLRSETYAQDSRIPQMEFGTPEQDAYRRDFTVNSLFYNINKGVVEDLTGKGLDDLRAGIIRTPLPPMETFLDGKYSMPCSCMRHRHACNGEPCTGT